MFHPRWMFHAHSPAQIVETQDALDALPYGWADSPQAAAQLGGEDDPEAEKAQRAADAAKAQASLDDEQRILDLARQDELVRLASEAANRTAEEQLLAELGTAPPPPGQPLSE